MNKFARGDKVLCINNRGMEGTLTLNEIYTVISVSMQNNIMISHDNTDDGFLFQARESRFIKVVEE